MQPLVSERTHIYSFYTLSCIQYCYLFVAQVVPASATETSSSGSLRPFPLTEPGAVLARGLREHHRTCSPLRGHRPLSRFLPGCEPAPSPRRLGSFNGIESQIPSRAISRSCLYHSALPPAMDESSCLSRYLSATRICRGGGGLPVFLAILIGAWCLAFPQRQMMWSTFSCLSAICTFLQ